MNKINKDRPMRVWEIYPIIKNRLLVENNSPYGGKLYFDETYGDFISQAGIKKDDSIIKLNNLLKQNGFRKINLEDL